MPQRGSPILGRRSLAVGVSWVGYRTLRRRPASHAPPSDTAQRRRDAVPKRPEGSRTRLANERPFAYTPCVTRRQEILHTAGDLFQRHGYHATSMRDIARSVQLQGSSLYAHIRSKEELLADIVDEAAAAFLDAAAAVDASAPPLERLHALVRAHLGVILEQLPHATVFFHEWEHLSPERKAAVVERRDAYQRTFRATLDAGVADGTFTVDDPSLATLFVLSSLNWTYQWLDPAGPLGLDELADRYAGLLARALGACDAHVAEGGEDRG